MYNEKTYVDISGLDKAEVLAALYNNAQPQGMGFLQFDPTPMTVEEAREILGGAGSDATGDYGTPGLRPRLYFDYFKGRVMKVDLSEDRLFTGLYNRDNGANAAEKVIEAVRNGEPAPMLTQDRTFTKLFEAMGV